MSPSSSKSKRSRLGSNPRRKESRFLNLKIAKSNIISRQSPNLLKVPTL